MIGSIAGDVIGSVYEWKNVKTIEFDLFSSHSRFTDDTVLTVAVADCILSGKEYADALKEYGRRYPNAGYGFLFARWLFSDDSLPYNSFGNGSAMRVSPIGFAYDSIERVLEESKKSAEVTHNHPEGVKGAQAVSVAVFLARKEESKENIKKFIENNFGYNLAETIEDIRPHYRFDVSCQGSVPQAIIAFLESENYEDAIRKAVSLGGDSDTIACITGGIAQAHYRKIPQHIIDRVRAMLPQELLAIIDSFTAQYVKALS